MQSPLATACVSKDGGTFGACGHPSRRSHANACDLIRMRAECWSRLAEPQRFTSSEEGADALAKEGVGTDGGSSELRPTSRDTRPRSQPMPSRADTPAHQIRTRSSGLR